MVKYSIVVEQASGGSQDIDIDLHINGLVQTKSQITIATASGGVSGVYNGGNFLLSPGDTLQLFKTNNTNSTDTNVSNTSLLVNLD